MSQKPVTWGPSERKGEIVGTFNANDGTKIAVVHVAGWWWNPAGYYQAEPVEGGCEMTLPVRMADLRPVEDPG